MLVQCKSSLRQRICKYTKNLQGVRNKINEFYYVNQHLPEQLAAERKEVNEKIKKIKDQNKGLSAENKIRFMVKNCQPYINNELQKKAVIKFAGCSKE